MECGDEQALHSHVRCLSLQHERHGVPIISTFISWGLECKNKLFASVSVPIDKSAPYDSCLTISVGSSTFAQLVNDNVRELLIVLSGFHLSVHTYI